MMKLKILPLFILITTSVFGMDEQTQISWNSAVVEAALANSGIRRDTYSKLFFNILNDLLQRDTFSVVDAVYSCKNQCKRLQPEDNLCSMICEKFGTDLVTQNNNYNAAIKSGRENKERCESRGNGFIWVNYYGVCAPRDVCSEDSWLLNKLEEVAGYKDVNYKAWCIKDFASTQVRKVKYAEDLAKSYMKNMIGEQTNIDCHVDIPEAGDKKSFSGNNYIPCMTGDGRYFVFEFDDTTEKFAGTPKYAFQALCSSLRGGISGSGDICVGLTKQQCETIAKQLDYSFVGDDDTKYNEITGDCKWD